MTKSIDLDDVTGLPQGSYFLGIILDDLQSVAESNENDNKLTYVPAFSFTSLANLTFYTGDGSDNSFKYDELTHELNLSADIINDGVLASGYCRMGYYLSADTVIRTSDYLVGSTNLNLGAGVHTNFGESIDLDDFSALPVGSYYVGVFIDDLQSVTESNENDNIFHYARALNYASSLPNLGFYTGEGSNSSFQYDESTHGVGVTFSVKNFGATSAGNFRIGCYISTDTLITTADYRLGSSVTVGGLESGKFATFAKTADLDDISVLSQGTYYFGLFIDDQFDVAESDETDNTAFYNLGVIFSPIISTLSVSENIVGIDKDGNNTASINITSNTSWSAVSDQNWLTVSPSTGVDNGTVVFAATANSSSIIRTATVTISATGVAYQFITVMQAAGTNGVSSFTTEIVSFYPNPVFDGFYLVGIDGKSTIILSDISGRVCLQKEVLSNEYIPVNSLPQGVYVLKLSSDNGIVEKKLVKR